MVDQVHNFLSPLDFRLSIARLPSTIYSVQNVSLPTVSIGELMIPTPFVRLKQHGDHTEFDNLSITFMVDEDMDNYFELLNWMTGLAPPAGFTEHATLSASELGLYSDMTLTIMNSTKNPNITFNFKNAHPSSLGSIELDTAQPDLVYAKCTVNFAFDYFTGILST